MLSRFNRMMDIYYIQRGELILNMLHLMDKFPFSGNVVSKSVSTNYQDTSNIVSLNL